MSTLKTAKKNKIEKAPYDSIIFLFLCILIFYPPFFRGLFFENELLPTHIVSFSLLFLLLLIKIKDKDFSLINSWPDFLGLGLVVLYFVSIFYGVNKRLAISEFLKYANYYSIYLMIKYLINEDDKRLKIIINTLLLSGVIVSVIGIGSAIGTFNYNGAFVSGRINSTLQYPNALAAYLFALFILALGILTITESKKEKCFYILCANTFFFTFIPTFSRGMWLLAPFILLLFFIFFPIKTKLNAFIDSLIVCIPSIILSFLFIQRIEIGNTFLLWSIFLLSILSSIGLDSLRDRFLPSDLYISGKKVMLVLFAIAAILSVVFVIALSVTEPLTLSNMNALEDINKVVARNVTGVLENHEYNLQADVKVSNNEQKPFSGQINVFSIDDQGKSELLHREDINEDGKISMDFSTHENTKSLNFRFLNRYANTEITFDNVILSGKQTNEEIKTFKLKYKYLPESIVTRLESYSTADNSAMSRVVFYKDAFKIIKDYPVFGTGGGGWSTLYFTYQSYMYWTTQAHNYFMQLWIEVGTVGVAIFVCFIVFLMYSGYKRFRSIEDHQNRIRILSIYMAWVTLIAHSIIDFDLSLGAVSILLWILLGMSCHDNVQIKNNDNYKKIQKYVMINICLLLIIGTFSLNEGRISAEKAVAAANNNQYEQSLKYFEKANRFDPYSAAYAIDLATLHASIVVKDETNNDKTIELIEKAIALEPYNAKLLTKIGQSYANLGEFDKALDIIDQTIKVQPMNIENHIKQMDFYIAVAKYLIEKQEKVLLQSVVSRIPTIKESLIHISKESAKPFGYNKRLDINMQKLEYLFDNQNNLTKQTDIDKVVLYSKLDLDLDRNEIPDGMRIVNTEGGALNLEKVEKGIALSNSGKNNGALWIDNITLKQNTLYELAIEYTSTVHDESFDMYIYDFSEGSKVIDALKNIEPAAHLQKSVLEFQTHGALTPEKQKIQIIHKGNDHGNITIQKISIIEK